MKPISTALPLSVPTQHALLPAVLGLTLSISAILLAMAGAAAMAGEPPLETSTVPRSGPSAPGAWEPLQTAWLEALAEVARLHGDALASQYETDLARPLAVAASQMEESEICSGRATPIEVRQALYDLTMEALRPLVPPPEVWFSMDRGLRQALPAAVPDDAGARCRSMGLAGGPRTFAVGPFTLTRQELVYVVGDRSDREAVIGRLASAFPGQAASLSREDLLSLVPSLVAASEPSFDPPAEVADAFFQAMVRHPEEIYQ